MDARSRVLGQESSCPSSPLECSKNLNYTEDGKKLSSSNFPESAEGSLKSKKTGLSSVTKSKNIDSGGGPSEASYANSLEMGAELKSQSDPPTQSNDGSEGLENEQNSVS